MSGHVLPLRVYLLVFGTLIVLTGLTTGIAYVHLGILNDYVAMTIAVVKALVVALFFMHLRYSSKLVWIVAGAGIAWLLILIALTLADYRTRPVVEGWSAAGGAWQSIRATTASAAQAYPALTATTSAIAATRYSLTSRGTTKRSQRW